MKYIIVSLLIILLLVLVYYNKETFTGAIIQQNLEEIKDKLPKDTRYKKLIREITDQLKTDFSKGTFFSDNIDKSNISNISTSIISDTNIQKSIKDNLKDDDIFKRISKGETGIRGDSGVSTANDVLEVGSLKISDQTIDETKINQMVGFSEGNRNLTGNKLIINPSINEKKAQEAALDDGTTLVPKLSLGGNIMAKDNEFIKIENGLVNKLKIGQQAIGTQGDNLFMNNVNISTADVKNLSILDNDLTPGSIGLKGDTGPQGWGIKSGIIEGDKVIFTNKGGGKFNVNFDKTNPIDGLFGEKGDTGNEGAPGEPGPQGYKATEGKLSEDGTLTLSYILPDNSKKSVTFTGDKLKGLSGARGDQGDKGDKGLPGRDIDDISVVDGRTNNLKLILNGTEISGNYKIKQGLRGDRGEKGNTGKNFELDGIINTKNGLLFNKDVNTVNTICFDDDQEYCINNDNKNLEQNDIIELTLFISKFLNIDQNKSFKDIVDDIHTYCFNITAFRPSRVDDDLENKLLKIPEIKQKLFNSDNSIFYSNRIQLCKIVDMDISKFKDRSKFNEAFGYIGRKEDLTTPGFNSNDKYVGSISDNDKKKIQETYLRYMFIEAGFKFREVLSNEAFFTKVKNFTEVIFDKKSIKIDTIEEKKNLLKFVSKQKTKLEELEARIINFYSRTKANIVAELKR